MNIYAIFSILSSIICIFLAGFVYSRGKDKPTNRSFGLVTALIGIWTLFPFISSLPVTDEEALFLVRIIYIAAIFVPSAYLKFMLHIMRLSQDKKDNIILKISYLISILFIIVSLNPIFIKGIARFRPDFAVTPGSLYIAFVLYFGLMYFYAASKLITKYRKTTGYPRMQLKYVGLAFFIAFISGVMHFLSAFAVKEAFPHDIFLAIYNIIMAYAIVKYRLMDIKLAITRTGIFIAVYTLILGLPFAVAIWLKSWLIEIFGPGWWMLPLGLMAALATVGPFIYIYLQRKAEDRLLKEQRRYQDSLKQASVGMTRIRNLRKLLDLITHIVTKTVRISYAAIYLYNQETDEYVLQVSRDKGRMAIPKLTFDNPLIAWIMLKREPLIYEEVKRQMEDTNDATYKHLEENMRLLTASVVIPSFLEHKFMGFIVLGDKISGQIYTVDDLNVFQVLASQAALAIENAQFYEEAKEMQEQIAQAEKMATIGTMADGLSHQINNRFYALSLIAGDTIDTIKITDTSKCTVEVKDMIEQISHALERIQSNVVQGGQVVRGLLKYSRKGEAGFEALDLNTVLDNTLEMVQFKVKLSEMDIIRDFPNDIPKIKGNMAQLEEAFFNFIDNAYDAIVERRTLLKEEGYQGKITISAYPKNNNLEIVVQDNGIGIKHDNHEKIFTPFFTTKTSTRKGTGLGLYVIRRIITDMHKGKIAFESEYKVGTRFILELPIAD